MKSDELPYIIYADITSLIKNIDGCADNPEKSSTTKSWEHIPCGYLLSAIQAFDHQENKRTLSHGKICMGEHAKDINDFATKRNLTFIKEELKSHQFAKVCYICGKESFKSFLNSCKT